MTVAFDSWAVLAWLQSEEPAASTVGDMLTRAEPAVISWINLAEVQYNVSRRAGARIASETTAALEEALRPELPTRAITLLAADLKAEHPMAFADCFAVATAAQFGLELWTGDPEIVDRASVLPCAVRDLR